MERQERIEDQKSSDMEEQHRDRVGEPMLFLVLADARKRIHAAFYRPQNRGQKGALADKHPRHVTTERLHKRSYDQDEDQDLQPSLEQRWLRPSEALGPQQSECEKDKKTGGHEAAEDIVDQHGASPTTRPQATV